MVIEKKIFTSNKPGQGLVWNDSDVKLVKSFQESKEEQKIDQEEERKKRFAIPEEVKPGSAEMIWYTMRNTILMNEDVANKARQEGRPDERIEALIEKQKMEQHMFNVVVHESMSANKAYDLMQEEIDGLERNKVPGSTELDDYIEAAKRVQTRLLDEMGRYSEKVEINGTAAKHNKIIKEDNVFHEKIDVDNLNEREKSYDRASELVLRDGGVRIHTSLERSLSPDGYSGFQDLNTRIQDGRSPAFALSQINNQFLVPGESSKGISLDNTLKKHDIREIINICHDIKEVYKTVIIPGEKGAFGIGKKPDRTEQQHTGEYEPVLHREYVSGGKEEAAVRLTYYIPPQTEWKTGSGRPGQTLSVEIVLPETTAKEVTQILEKYPAAIRKIVERVMKEKLLKDPKSWEAPQESGGSLCPPYDKWDAQPNGGKIYIQKEDMISGFHEELMRKV